MPIITFDLDDDLHAMLCDIARKYGQRPEVALEQILVSPIHNNHFLAFTASHDYFEGRPAVTDEEAETARQFVAKQIIQAPAELRAEALIYGLTQVAIEIGVMVCGDAGYIHADQHGEGLADSIFRKAGDKHREGKFGPCASS